MKYFDWDQEKNGQLKIKRGIGFEDVVAALDDGKLLVTIDNPNKVRYPNQKIYVINIDNYAYIVPFVEDEERYFLKTIFPSRKMTKRYLIKGKQQ